MLRLVRERIIWFSSLFVCFTTAAFAAEPTVDPKDLPRIPPTAPDKALSTFRIKSGFRLELVAAEPLVVDPIAMSFDENGRLFVVEMRDYSERRDERLGRIRLLEDTDGDGRFDKSTVYLDHLPWPTAVICYNGGIFVGATPDILYCKDTNGDGVADVKEVVFTGFASDYAPYQTNRLNVQAMLNSFNWGLDNRIHGATSMSGGKVVSAKHPEAPALELRGRDFSFDPRDLTLRAESGGGQHGLSFDNRGRKFVCSNSSHIQMLMYEERYAARNPYFPLPSALVGIAVDGPAAEVYRLSPDEPWRVIRTQWRVSGLVPGPVEGGGRPSGYFTGATGVTIYRGNAFPEEFLGDAFVADCGSNLVHRKKLRPANPVPLPSLTPGERDRVRGHGSWKEGMPASVELKAERPADEQKVEFLASTDNWFRPVQFANAPDGALYIADMYREVIEHPWSLPQSIKQHLDLNSGNDRGRIYRIVPEGFKQPKLPRLGQATTAELIATLEHPNGWHRDTAARLLYERQDQSAVPLLEKLLRNSKSGLGRMHALCALDGLNALNEASLSAALQNSADEARQHGVRLAEKYFARNSVTELLAQKLAALGADPDPLVRYQLAFTLASLPEAQRLRVATALATSGENDEWIRRALLNSSADLAGKLFSELSRRDFNFPGKDQVVPSLATLIGTQDRPKDVVTVLDKLSGLQPGLSLRTTAGLVTGLQTRGRSLAEADPDGKLRPVFALARSVATNQFVALRGEETAASLQGEAIRLLGFAPFAEASPVLFGLLEPKNSESIQVAALTSLGRFAQPQLGDELVRRWPAMTPRVRAQAVTLLLARTERIETFLAAIENKQISPTELSSTQEKFLRAHRDASVRQRAEKILGALVKGSRQQVVDAFLSALNLTGDANRGQKVYLERCSSCHRLGGQGYALGPDLATVRTGGKEKILTSILDPNREVAPNYQNYLVETKDDESVLGIIGNETASSVTLKQANGGEVVVLRSNIARMQSQGQSAMPEGLEVGLGLKDFADLLEFVVNQK